MAVTHLHKIHIKKKVKPGGQNSKKPNKISLPLLRNNPLTNKNRTPNKLQKIYK